MIGPNHCCCYHQSVWRGIRHSAAHGSNGYCRAFAARDPDPVAAEEGPRLNARACAPASTPPDIATIGIQASDRSPHVRIIVDDEHGAAVRACVLLAHRECRRKRGATLDVESVSAAWTHRIGASSPDCATSATSAPAIRSGRRTSNVEPRWSPLLDAVTVP